MNETRGKYGDGGIPSPGSSHVIPALIKKFVDAREGYEPIVPVWGDGTASTATVGGTGIGLSNAGAITHTVYGQLPDSTNNQSAPAGNYTDSITVTVEY